jgi:hypothetical protein
MNETPADHQSDGYFDAHIAATYDDDAEIFTAAAINPVVDFLADLAGSGQALELGVGTGRIALPLARKGTPVHGIDMSQAMIDILLAKPDASKVAVTRGDFATTRIDGTFSLAYLVFNTIMNLTSQRAQVACFRNAAAHLNAGGYFVIEVLVPALQRLPRGEHFVPFDISKTHWGVDEYDLVSQALTSHHLHFVDGKTERHSLPARYVWPSELDLMAELAGMRLHERWQNWQREPFTGSSESHVSVWQKTQD